MRYYEEELIDIIQEDLPVNALYVNNYAMNAFRDISLKTGGESAFLDINSHNGA